MAARKLFSKGATVLTLDRASLPALDARLLAADIAHARARRLRKVYVAGAVDDATVEITMEALARARPPLAELTFTRTNFRLRGARAIADALPSLPSLEILALNCCHAGDDAVAAVLESARAHTPLLSWLDMNENDALANGAGMRALLSALPAFPRLRNLALSGFPLGDAGVAALVETLSGAGETRRPSMLQDLFLMNVDVGDAGVATLASALGRFAALKALWLHENTRITDAGAVALAAAMPSVPALEQVCLDGASLTTVGVNALMAALPNCPNMTEQLSLGIGYGVRGVDDDAVYKLIATLLRKNKRRANAARKQAASGAAAVGLRDPLRAAS